MSLYLPEQRLGQHTQPGAASHKFMLKGRQAGGLHRGHHWVFRAESFDTMYAWYEDLKNLTEKTGEARNAFVRKHVRSFSGVSYRASSISSDGVLDEDEADELPYSANHMMPARGPSLDEPRWRTPPGGRFPSEVHLNRTSEVPESPSSEASSRERKEAMGVSSFHQEAGIHFNSQRYPQHQSHMHETESPEATLINARSNSVRSTKSRKPKRIYEEWMTDTHHSAAPHQPITHEANANQIYSPSPQVSRNGTRIRSIASSTGAPIIVPDGMDNSINAQLHTRETEPSLLSTQPTGTDSRTIPSLTTAATSLGALDGDFPSDRESESITPTPNNVHTAFGPPSVGYQNNDVNFKANNMSGLDNSMKMQQSQPQGMPMPTIGARTTTVSDLKVPGQYPANRS